MAISTGDICTDAIDEMQALLASTGTILTIPLEFPALCFIFGKKIDYSDVDMREDLQDMADWFNAQSWLTDGNRSAILSWHKQRILLGAPAYGGLSTGDLE